MPERAKDGTSSAQPRAPRKPGLAEAYATLESMLRASPRGRWFLAEYARRNRTAETEMLLEVLARIERAVLKPAPRHAVPVNVFAELVEMSEAIARARREIAQIKPPHQFDQFDEQIFNAARELDHIVEATEKATSDILEAAEEIQEVAWTLREKGTDIELCDKIDQRATDIYTACSFQDITGQRTEKVVKALRFIEHRINALIEVWGVDDIAFKVDDIASKMHAFAEAVRDDSRLLHGPHPEGTGLKQDDVDRMLHETRANAGASAHAEPPEGLDQRRSAPSSGSENGLAQPEPLTFAELGTVKRGALFG